MLDWDDLRFLLALQRTGSLARAAALLEVDKSTVGRRLDTLEAALGEPLVQRLPAGYRLTAAGQRACETAHAMSDLLDDLLGQSQAHAAAGVVRLTAPAWFSRMVLIPALPEFRAEYPQLELEFLTTNLVVSMTKREADLAIRNLRPEERGLVSRRLGELGSMLYGSNEYLASTGPLDDRDSLARCHFVSYHERLSHIEGFAWLEVLGAPVAFRASDTLALAEACTAGLGLAVLPCWLGDAAPLQRVALAGHCQETIWLVMPSELRHRPALRGTANWVARLFALHAARLGGRMAPPGAAA
jgi:DNA-binding transcriptional LysR family regulator